MSTTDKVASTTEVGLGIATAVVGGMAASAQSTTGTTALFRAVLPGEAESIQTLGGFSNPSGIEVKYFSTSLEGAQSYASQATAAFGDGPFTIVGTGIPTPAITPEMQVTVDRGIKTVVVSTQDLPKLTPPKVIEPPK
jgi:hypothetical protein